MDPQRKKQLKQEYSERKPLMGVMEMRCRATGESFLIATNDLHATENGLIARFDGGSHPNKRLQALWSEHGREGFSFELVEELEYDDAREDYAEDLQELLELYLEEHPGTARVWR